jgi:hypothetical protein
MRRNITRRSRRSRAPRQTVSRRPVDPVFTAQRFNVPPTHIPQHVVAPSVTRTVRYTIVLTSGTPSAAISYSEVALQDGVDYLGTAAYRYVTMRFHQVRAWAESPASLGVSQQTYGLILSDANSGFFIKDKPTTGSRLAAVGLRFPFTIRQQIAVCSSTTAVVTVSCDTTIAASTDFTVTCDFTVEFFA